MLKVLYYNWTDYRSPRGGGVTVYLRNLLASLTESREISPFFLSSGDVYSPFSSQPYIRQRKEKRTSICPVFELINSPIPAPGALLSHNLQTYLRTSDTTILELFRNFIIRQGGFDVIHFHNLEGLPLNILKIKEYFPQTKIIFSLHNYFPLCPGVQLFQHHKECRCQNFGGGEECVLCHHKQLRADWFVEPLSHWFQNNSLWPRLLKPWIQYKSKRLAEELLSIKQPLNSPQVYKDFRSQNIAFLNLYADKILAVSARVRQIAVDYGINPHLLELAYIGTDYAAIKPLKHSLVFKRQKVFTLAFLGYARVAKGFFFLLSALEKLPLEVSSTINLRLAARHILQAVDEERLQKLKQRFHHLEIYDGYRREDLPQLLKGVDLGVVPVIWEDNLPQVAIEMAAHGVAVLASDFGGASELSSSPYFHFQGNNQADFTEKLLYIKAHPEVLAEYHQNRRPLTTMPQHLNQLREIYLRPTVAFLQEAG